MLTEAWSGAQHAHRPGATEPPRGVPRLGWSHVRDTSRRYPAELKQRAVRMFAEVRGDHVSDWAAMAKVAELLGIGTPETLRKWVRQAEIDQGARAGATSEESAEVRRLKRENAALKRANAILKAASAFFAAELDRPIGSSN